MKEIKEKMSLYQITRKEMNVVKGGTCGCACHYVNCGGSSSADNGAANRLLGAWSTGPGCQ